VAPVVAGGVAFVDARDVAAVAAQTLVSDGHANAAYTLTGPAAVSFQDVAASIGRAIGKDVQYVVCDHRAARDALAAAGTPGWLVDYMLGLYDGFDKGAGELVTGDVRDIIGRDPVDLDVFTADHACAFTTGA
jgi:uncharacterized protein YbjT (DUF2867 family)